MATLRSVKILQEDAFGRIRVAGTGQRLDSEFVYNKQEDFFDEVTNNGTATFNSDTRDITLSISDAVAGTHATMASHPVPYTPGNSQLIDITGVLDLAGIGGGVAQCFLRSSITGSIVEEEHSQVTWDRLDGASDVDWTKSQIFSIDFQSLKVGRIRYGIVKDGVFNLVKEIKNDNVRDSGYWQNPSLPAYWKLYNDATYTYMEMGYGNDDNAVGFRYRINANASATMRAICATVKSEGGLSLRDMPGLPRCIDNGTTVVSATATLTPILSIRAKSTFAGLDNLVISLPKGVSVTTDNPIKLVLLYNVTLTAPTWVDVDAANSSIEYDVSASAVAGGHVVSSSYISTPAKNTPFNEQGFLGKAVLWNRQDGLTGIFTVAAIRTTGTSANVLAALNWEEIR